MASEDTAARVAEIRARHAEYPPPEWSEVAILLAALAAVEAERDHAVREVQLMQGSFAAVEAERDQQTALVCQWDERDHAKTVQLARLAALEAAARALAGDHAAYARGAITSDVWEACRRLGVGRIIMAARALDAPPGESSEEGPCATS